MKSATVFPAIVADSAFALLGSGPAATGAEEEPLMGTWVYYPTAHGTPETPLPPPEELLKVVPPLRPVPEFSQEAKALGVALWWGDYSQLIFSEQPPSTADLARKPEIRTPPGEDEPLILGAWGLAEARSLTLSVKESPFPVTIRNIEFAPRYLPTPYRGVKVEGGRVVGIASYMPEAGYAEVPPGRSTVYWLNVAVPPEADPGVHEIKLQLIVHQQKVIELNASVEVLPFTLPRADVAYGMYFRPLAHVQPRYQTPALMRAYYEDMARHGMTSATLYQYTRSGSFLDREGNPKPLDGHEDFRRLTEMKGAGLIHADTPIMLLSSNLTQHPEGAKAVKDELQRRGFPEILLYGWDEPPVNEKAQAFFESLKPVREYLRITTAITDHAAAAYADLIDVWTLNGGRVTPEIRQLGREKGRELWTYDCNHRGRGNSTRARFYAGIYTWALELKGNFHWCYTEHYSWEGDRNATFNFVLPSDGGPVPSPAWEGRREGTEDYRLLRLLEARIAADPATAEAVEAKAYLAGIRSRVDWDLVKRMPKSVYPWDGAEMYPMCPDFEPAELSAIRTRLIDHVLALSAE